MALTKKIGVMTPTGSLGGGFNFGDFRRCMAEEEIDVIAVDSGSTDIGPYYLGSGLPFPSKIEMKGRSERSSGQPWRRTSRWSWEQRTAQALGPMSRGCGRSSRNWLRRTAGVSALPRSKPR